MKVAQRNKFLLGLLVTSIGATVLLYVFGFDKSADFRVDKDLFRVPRLGEVDSVVLQSAASRTTLTYDGVRWHVNGNQVADNRMITLLFATLEQVEPRRAVPTQQEGDVRTRLENQGIKLELHAGDEKVGSLRLVGDAGKGTTYFALGDEIYSVNIPGYRVYVAGIFEMPTLDWREKRIFNFNWRNFKGLTASFPSQPGEGFVVGQTDGAFGIRGMSKVDTTQLNNYLDAVSLTEANQLIEPTRDEYDSILQTRALAQIEVIDIGNRTYQLQVFRLDKEHVLGKMGDGTLLILSAERWLPMSRRRSDFRLDRQTR